MVVVQMQIYCENLSAYCARGQHAAAGAYTTFTPSASTAVATYTHLLPRAGFAVKTASSQTTNTSHKSTDGNATPHTGDILVT